MNSIRSVIACFFCLVIGLQSIDAQNLIPYRVGELWGYSDPTGTIRIQPRYSAAKLFRHGFGVVKRDHFYGMINSQGDSVKPAVYDNIGEFHRGLCRFKMMGKYGYFEKSGKVAIEPQFAGASSFFDYDLASVMKGGKYGFIDKTGKLVIPYTWEQTSPMSELGFATVYKSGHAGLINEEGAIVVPFKYKEKDLHVVKPEARFKKNFRQLKRKDGKKGDYGILFNTGTTLLYYETTTLAANDHFLDNKYLGVIIPKQEGDASKNPTFGLVDQKGDLIMQTSDFPFLRRSTDEGLIVGKAKGSGAVYGYVNLDGETVIKPKYEEFEEFQDGVARVSLKGSYGFVDTKGELIVEMKDIGAIRLGDYRYGVYRYGTESKNFLADINGKIIITAPRNNHFEFKSHGLLTRRKQGRFQLIKPDGSPASEVWYMKVRSKRYGFKVMLADEQVGILNKDASVAIEAIYEEIVALSDKYLKAKKDGKYGVIDYSGNEVLPFDYSGILYVHESGNFWVGERLVWKMVNKENKTLNADKYNNIEYCQDGHYNVYKSQWGVVDPNGELVVPLVCRERVEPVQAEGMFGLVRAGNHLQGYIGKNFSLYWREN